MPPRFEVESHNDGCENHRHCDPCENLIYKFHDILLLKPTNLYTIPHSDMQSSEKREKREKNQKKTPLRGVAFVHKLVTQVTIVPTKKGP